MKTHGARALAEARIEEIRALLAEGTSKAEIARRLGVSHWLVGDMLGRNERRGRPPGLSAEVIALTHYLYHVALLPASQVVDGVEGATGVRIPRRRVPKLVGPRRIQGGPRIALEDIHAIFEELDEASAAEVARRHGASPGTVLRLVRGRKIRGRRGVYGGLPGAVLGPLVGLQ